jgi:hypothetical protein
MGSRVTGLEVVGLEVMGLNVNTLGKVTTQNQYRKNFFVMMGVSKQTRCVRPKEKDDC